MKTNTSIGNTQQFASQYFVKPQTVLRRYCQTGSYFGVIPTKLANGRLAWPLNVSKEDNGSIGK